MRYLPPDGKRVPILIHPNIKEELREFLMFETTIEGEGYTEFIARALAERRERGTHEVPDSMKAFSLGLYYGLKGVDAKTGAIENLLGDNEDEGADETEYRSINGVSSF